MNGRTAMPYSAIVRSLCVVPILNSSFFLLTNRQDDWVGLVIGMIHSGDRKVRSLSSSIHCWASWRLYLHPIRDVIQFHTLQTPREVNGCRNQLCTFLLGNVVFSIRAGRHLVKYISWRCTRLFSVRLFYLLEEHLKIYPMASTCKNYMLRVLLLP